MEIIELLKSEFWSIIFGSFGGVGAALLTQKFLNKRGLFSYFVEHNRVGMSSQDSIFGDVLVTWNGNTVEHLFLSTVELKNESLNDYEDVVIHTYTNDTKLLTESTQIIETPNVLKWTDNYSAQMKIGEDGVLTESQLDIYRGQREYLIPVFNRGEQVRITYLNSANTSKMPNIWLSATVKGVKIKFQPPQNQVYGVPQARAGIIGAILGFIFLIPLVIFVPNNWAVAFLAFSYGLIAQLPGAGIIKIYRKIRDTIGG